MLQNEKILDSGKNINEIYSKDSENFQELKEKIKQELVEFENEIVEKWEKAEIAAPIHFSGGNEDQIIEMFKQIKRGDYIFGTHRAHYHYLLAGGSPEKLKEIISEGNSMHIFNKEINFITSAIVAGNVAIAVGVALALKKKGSNKKVWCFVGDGTEDTGHFYEAVRYVDGWDLPCIFVIEDNNRSVDTPKEERYGRSEMSWPKCVVRYKYAPTYPHVGTNKWMDFGKQKAGGSSF